METGIGLNNPLFFVGVIENNNDPRKEGRVQVRAFGVHGLNDKVPRDSLPWALVMSGDYSPNNVPKINSWVFGVFLDGRDAQEPMVMGLIPTQYAEVIDPEKNGWGWIPTNSDSEALGSRPEDIMEPQQSRLLRGERVEETSVLQQEMGRVRNVQIGGSETTWDQPNSAFNTEYPKNNVWETGCHTIELDDTDGSERITVKHKSGSFIEIDSRGTTVHKTVGDHYDVLDRKEHKVVGGMSTVTIYGNSYVYVKGNKIEEIEGDLQTLVHGNHHISVGGQSTIQGGEQVQIRGGGDVKVNAASGTLAINAGKEMQISAGDITKGVYGAISVKGEKILVDATDKLGLRGLTQVNIQSVAEMNLSAITMNQFAAGAWNAYATTNASLTAAGTTEISGVIELAVSSGAKVNLNAPTIAADTFITLANGVSRPAAPVSPATVAKFAMPPIGQKPFVPGSAIPEVAWYAATVAAPEPTSKSMSINQPEDQGSLGTTGYVSLDHGVDAGNVTVADVSSQIQSAATPLLDFIGNKESNGYDDISGLISQKRYPVKKITQMTIQEILDWQESIDTYQLSEAVGRYQIIEDTLRGYNNDRDAGPGRPLYTRAGLSAGDLFSPINQDQMAIVLLEGRGLTKFIDGDITKETFANNLASEWASLPQVTGPNAGKSKYAGDDAGNKSLVTVSEFLAVLDQVKSRSRRPDVINPESPEVLEG